MPVKLERRGQLERARWLQRPFRHGWTVGLRNLPAATRIVEARLRAAPSGHGSAGEHRDFSAFSRWPTKRQASSLPARSASSIPVFETRSRNIKNWEHMRRSKVLPSRSTWPRSNRRRTGWQTKVEPKNSTSKLGSRVTRTTPTPAAPLQVAATRSPTGPAAAAMNSL